MCTAHNESIVQSVQAVLHIYIIVMCFFLFVVLLSLHLTPKPYPTARKDKLDDMQFL